PPMAYMPSEPAPIMLEPMPKPMPQQVMAKEPEPVVMPAPAPTVMPAPMPEPVAAPKLPPAPKAPPAVVTTTPIGSDGLPDLPGANVNARAEIPALPGLPPSVISIETERR